MYTVILERPAQKQFKKIPHQYQAKILKALEYLAADPFSGKKMKGEYEDQYTLRVWPYRIIYKIDRKQIVVFVLAIGHRQGAY